MELVLRESVDAALASVAAGEADVVIVDGISLALFDPQGALLVPVGAPLVSDPYVILLPVGAPKLLEAINDALADLEADGTLAELKTRWIGANLP